VNEEWLSDKNVNIVGDGLGAPNGSIAPTFRGNNGQIPRGVMVRRFGAIASEGPLASNGQGGSAPIGPATSAGVEEVAR